MIRFSQTKGPWQIKYNKLITNWLELRLYNSRPSWILIHVTRKFDNWIFIYRSYTSVVRHVLKSGFKIWFLSFHEATLNGASVICYKGLVDVRSSWFKWNLMMMLRSRSNFNIFQWSFPINNINSSTYDK